MKYCVLFLCLVGFAATAFAQNTSATNYPVKVHVVSCHIVAFAGENNGHQQLEVIIEGKKYVLDAVSLTFPTHPGDYQARLLKDEKKDTGQFYREYEILFADGKAAKYRVTGESE